MKEQLKESIMQTIASWDGPDIYVVSLYVYDYDDDPCRPTVTVGYNTESYLNEQLECPSQRCVRPAARSQRRLSPVSARNTACKVLWQR